MGHTVICPYFLITPTDINCNLYEQKTHTDCLDRVVPDPPSPLCVCSTTHTFHYWQVGPGHSFRLRRGYQTLVPGMGRCVSPAPRPQLCTLQSKGLVARGKRLFPRLLLHVYGNRSDRPADRRVMCNPPTI